MTHQPISPRFDVRKTSQGENVIVTDERNCPNETRFAQ